MVKPTPNTTSKPFDLTIVIVNYNGQSWLEQTLKTLKTYYIDHSKLLQRVVVVDNSSTDHSKEYLQRQDWLELIELPENVGFAAGNNVALKQVLETKASRYVMLLNSDMELDQRSNFDHLVEFLDIHPQTAVVTPQVLLPTGQLDPACHRGEPTLWASLAYFSGLEKLFPTSPLFARYHLGFADLSEVHSIDACSGAAMMIRTSAMAEVGLLDERFFMYAEDLDWCKRFREAGHQIMYIPSVTIIHHKNKSGLAANQKATANTTKQYFYTTMIQYFDKHYKLEYPSIVRSLVKWVVSIKKHI